jgi:hypothetical protein
LLVEYGKRYEGEFLYFFKVVEKGIFKIINHSRRWDSYEINYVRENEIVNIFKFLSLAFCETEYKK